MADEATTNAARFGPYVLRRLIGRGGMGKVYLADDERGGPQVAIKILSSRLAKNKIFVDRFHREASAAAQFDHPNIVQAIEAGEANDRHYFAMEYVDGETLKARVKRSGPLSEQEALSICDKVAMALEHAAEHHIIHRDVKPDNVMISSDGEVKLMDMGLAKNIEDDSATVTQAGTMIGTPQYASPEQLRGEPDIDLRTDLYSLGITLYYLLVGRAPFDGETTAVITSRQISEEVPSPRDSRPELSQSTANVVWRMTRKKREDRYQTPSELLEDIRKAYHGQDVAGPVSAKLGTAVLRRRSDLRRAQRRKFRPVPLTAAAAVAILGLVLAYTTRQTAPAAAKGRGPNSRPPVSIPVAKAGPPAPATGAGDPGPTEPVAPADPEDGSTTALSVPSEPEPPEGKGDPEPETKPEERAEQNRQIFEQAQALARQMTQNGRFSAALKSLADADEILAKTEWAAQVKEARTEVMAAAETKLSAVLQGIDAAVRRGEFDDAQVAVEDARKNLPSSFETILGQALEKIESGKAALAKSRALLAGAEKEARAHVSKREYQRAREALAEVRGRLRFSETLSRAEELDEQISGARKAWQKGVDELSGITGRTFSVGGFTGTLQAVDEKTLTVASPQGSVAVPISKITTAQLVRLAGKPAQETGDEDLLIGLIWLSYHEGKFLDLLPQLRKLSEATRYRSVLDEVELTIREGWADEADEAWKEIVKSARARKWRDLQARLEAFEADFAKTQHLQSRRAPIDELRNAAEQASKRNQVLSLSSDRENLIVDRSPAASDSSLTVEAWVRTTKRGVVIVERGADLYGYSLVINWDGIPCFLVRSSGHALTVVPGADPVDDGRFHHLAGVLSVEESRAFLVVDGVKAGELNCRAIQGEPVEPLSIGGPGDAGVWGRALEGSLQGSLDELRIWKVARTVEELRAGRLRRLPDGVEGLVAYWNFDESSRDLTPGRNHLRLESNGELILVPWEDLLPPLLSDAEETEEDGESEALKAAARLFKGKAQARKDGRVAITYGFDRVEEGLDWVPEHGAAFHVKGGQLHSVPSGFRGHLWHRAHFIGDVALEFKGKSADGLYCVLKGNGSVKRAPGYSLGLSAKRREANIWRFGYRSPVAEGMHNVDLSQFVALRAATEGSRLTLSANDTVLVEGDSPDLLVGGNGRIALYSTREPTVWDEVCVVGRLDRRWLRDELRSWKLEVPEGDYALRFDGEESRLTVPPLPEPSSGSFTWEAWLNLVERRNVGLFSFGRHSEAAWLAIGDGGQLLFRAGDPERRPLQWDTPPGLIPWNEWVHLAVVHDGQELRLYVNGKGVQRGKWQRNGGGRGGEFFFGGAPGGNYMSGMLDEIRLSRIARYTRNFRPQRTFEPDENTVALYHLNGGQGDWPLDSAQGTLGAMTRGTEWALADTGQSVKEALLWKAAKNGDPDVMFGLEFDGADDSVDFRDSPKLNLRGALTVEAWIKVDHFRYHGAIIDKGNDSSHSFTLANDGEGQLYFMSSDANGRHYVASRPLHRDQIYHVAATFEKGRARIFINGELHEEKLWPMKALPASRGAPFTLGKAPRQEYSGHFSGRIYQVRISAAARYQQKFDPEKELTRDRKTVLLLPMAEGKGFQLKDSVPAGRSSYSGVITGATWVPDQWE